MVVLEKPKTPEPIYKNTVVCNHCYAEYNPNLTWVSGNYETGTTGVFVSTSKIKKGKCPVCRKGNEK